MRGLGKELLKVLPDEPRVEIRRTAEEHLRITIKWPDGLRSARFDLWDDKVYWHSLRAPMEGGPKGLYSHFCKVMPRVFKPRGIDRFEMTIPDPKWRDVYLKRGHWEPGTVEYSPGLFTEGYVWKL